MSETADATMEPAATMLPATPTSHTTGLSTPKGFTICGKSTSGPAFSALPTTPPAVPSATPQATGRHRGEGSRPSENNSNSKLRGTNIRRYHNHEENHAAVSPMLLTPKPPASQNSAKSPAKELKPTVTPTPQKSQPMALRGCFDFKETATTENGS